MSHLSHLSMPVSSFQSSHRSQVWSPRSTSTKQREMNEATKWVNGKLSKYFSSCSLVFSYTFPVSSPLSVYLLDVICLSLKTGHESSSRKRERECNSLLLSCLSSSTDSSRLPSWIEREEGERRENTPNSSFPFILFSSFWVLFGLFSRRNREWKTLLPSLSIFDLILFHYHVSLMILKKNQESLELDDHLVFSRFPSCDLCILPSLHERDRETNFYSPNKQQQSFPFPVSVLISVSDFSSFRFVIFYFMKNANNKSIDQKVKRNTQSSKT